MRRRFQLHQNKRPAASLIVEVTGPRGVGKSTFVQLLRAELDRQNVDHDQLAPLRFHERAAFWLAKLLGRPYTRSTWLKWEPVSSEELRLFQRRYWTYRYRLWRFSRSPGIHILDEGVHQLMLSLQAKTMQKDIELIANRLKRLVRFPDLVVFLAAPEEEIRLRRLARGNPRDRLKPTVSPAGREAMLAIREMLKRLPNGQDQVIFIDSVDRSLLATAAEETARIIAAKARRSPGSPPASLKT